MTLELAVKNDKVLTSSRTIAKAFGKEVGEVNRAIRDRFGDDGKIHRTGIITNYRDNGQVYEYLLNDKQAFLLTMGFKGAKARELQDKLISVYLDVRPAGADPLGFYSNKNNKEEGK